MRSTAEWIETLTRHGIWHSAVNDYEGVVADPQVAHSGSFVTVEGSTGTPVTLVRHPVRYDGEAPDVRLPPQPLGAQTADILAELGFATGDIEALLADGVVAAAK